MRVAPKAAQPKKGQRNAAAGRRKTGKRKAKTWKQSDLRDAALLFRRSLGEGQDRFWGRFGVGQTVGSRYEQGRARIPMPVQMLILAYALGMMDDEALRRLRLTALPELLGSA